MEGRQVNPIGLIREILRFCSNNLKAMIKISLFVVVLIFASYMILGATFLHSLFTMEFLGRSFFKLLFGMILVVLITMELMLVATIFISRTAEGLSPKIFGCFKPSFKLYFRYLGGTIFVSFIMLIPTTIFTLMIWGLSFVLRSYWAFICLYIVMLILVMALQVRFNFLPTIMVIRSTRSSFDYNSYMLKGNFWSVYVLFLLVNVVVILVALALQYAQGIWGGILMIGYLIASVLVIPIALSAPVIIIRELEKTKDDGDIRTHIRGEDRRLENSVDVVDHNINNNMGVSIDKNDNKDTE